MKHFRGLTYPRLSNQIKNTKESFSEKKKRRKKKWKDQTALDNKFHEENNTRNETGGAVRSPDTSSGVRILRKERSPIDDGNGETTPGVLAQTTSNILWRSIYMRRVQEVGQLVQLFNRNLFSH